MAILRISQQRGSGPNRHHIAVEAEVPGVQRLSFSREIEFALSPQDGEKIRWYLEDYLQFAQDPAPQIAARVEDLMAERGEALFRAIFEGLYDAHSFGRLSHRICLRRESKLSRASPKPRPSRGN